MKRLIPTSLLFLMTGILLLACAPQVIEVERVSTQAGAAPIVADGDSADLIYEEALESETNREENLASQQERLIIRNGNIDIVAIDTKDTMNLIAQQAESLGGWVVNRNVYTYSGPPSGNISIRVPADQFDQTLDFIRDNAVEVRSESSSGEDVTEEFVDLNSRLGNLEATAEVVEGFLEEAETVEEALAVNQELRFLNEEIEVIKGRMQYLSESAAFSTIYISITPDELNQPIEIAGWRPQGIARDAVEALVRGLQGFATFLIWLAIYLVPMGLLILGPLYFIGRWAWRRWRGRKSSRPEPAAEEPAA